MMRFLIDTHRLIWFLDGNSLLSTKKRSYIVDGNNSVLVSIASLWEIGIKMSLGKLDLAATIPAIIKKIASQSIEILAITPDHVLKVSNLPFHHKDPFNRMIIAQALAEQTPLMTVDSDLAKYGVKMM